MNKSVFENKCNIINLCCQGNYQRLQEWQEIIVIGKLAIYLGKNEENNSSCCISIVSIWFCYEYVYLYHGKKQNCNQSTQTDATSQDYGNFFSVFQLVVTLANFILAELGVKNSFDAYVFSLVFAIIVAAFNIIYAGGVSNSSGFVSPIAPAADHQL